MAATEVPPAGTAPAIWYVGRGTVRKGPYRLEVLVAAIRAGRLRGDDWVWRAGMADWLRADCVPEIEAHFPPDPAPAPPDAAVAVARLHELYPHRGSFTRRFVRGVIAAVDERYLLPVDGVALAVRVLTDPPL